MHYTTFLNAYMRERLHFLIKESFFSPTKTEKNTILFLDLCLKSSYILKNNNDFHRKFFEDGILKILDFLNDDIVVGFGEFIFHLTVTTS